MTRGVEAGVIGTGRGIDAARPVDPGVGMRGDQLAVRAIEYIHEAVLVGLDHDLAHLSVDHKIGHYMWDVAHVHLALLNKRRAAKSE